MPALTGEIRISLHDDSGAPVFTVYEFYSPTTFAMVDGTVTTSRGSRTGAVVVDNQTGRAQTMIVTTETGDQLRTFNVAPTGANLSAAQLSSVGVNVIQDLNGISPSLVP